MKSLFENWRKFRNEEKEEVLEEELIQEFKESDKAAILEAGERFTISYEIELLSNLSAGAAGRGDLPTLEQFAKEYLDQNYFYETISDRALEDFYDYEFLEDYSTDTEGLVAKYIDEEVIGIPPQAQNAFRDHLILLFEMAISMGDFGAPELYQQTLEMISKDGSREANSFLKLLLEHPLIKTELEEYTEIKATQRNLELDPEDEEGQLIHILSGIDTVELFKKYVFDLDAEWSGFPKVRYFDKVISLDDFYETVLGTDELLIGIMDEMDEFIVDRFVIPERNATLSSMSNIGYSFREHPSPHLKAMAKMIDTAIDEYIDEQSSSDYEEFTDDPVRYLEFNFDYNVQEEYYNRYDVYPGEGEGEAEDMHELMYEHLPNFMAKYASDIKLEEDASLSPDPHVEFSMDYPAYITGLEEALEYLETFFTDFENQDNFYMDNRTGLHTNVGILDEEDDPIEDYDLMKALLFLNHEFATKGFESRRYSGWAGDIKKEAINHIATLVQNEVAQEVRPGVWKIMDDPTGNKEITSVLKNLTERDFDAVKKALSDAVEASTRYTSSKQMGFNIKHIPYRKYVEFRYPGHDSLNFDVMKNATLYYSHIIKLSTDPQYKNDEYMKKLVGFINNLKDVEYEKATSLDRVKALKKGTIVINNLIPRNLVPIYHYLTSEAEREPGLEGVVFPSSLDKGYAIYNGIDPATKSARLEAIQAAERPGAERTRGGLVVLDNMEYRVEEFLVPLVVFEASLKKGRTEMTEVTRKPNLEKLIRGIYETIRENPLRREKVRSYSDKSQEIWDLRARLQSIRGYIERAANWHVTDDDRELIKKYENKKDPSSPPDEEQQKLRQILRKNRLGEETQEEEPTRRPQSDEEGYTRSGERPRLPPISGRSGPVPYEMGYEAAEDEGEEESLETMKQQRKFAKDGVITIPKSSGGPWSGTIEEFERFWRLGAQRASGEGPE
jgi:hypothetical protein